MPPPSSDRFSEDAPSPEPPCEPVCEPARPRLPRLEALSFLSGAGDRGAAVLGPEGKSNTTLQEAGQVWVRLAVVVEVPAAAGSEAPGRPGVRVAAAIVHPATALALRRKAEAMKEAYQRRRLRGRRAPPGTFSKEVVAKRRAAVSDGLRL